MNKHILLKVFVLCCVYSVSEARKSTNAYCWRDYDGTVPPDALIAGAQYINHQPIYIGQTIYEDKLIAGKLYNNDNKIYFEYFSVEYSKENSVKILCAQHPNQFEWLPTRNTEVRRLTNKILITGGFEPKCSMYLGRTKTDEGVAPGKVMCCEGIPDCYGLYTSYNGTGTLHGEFEILTYNETPNVGLRTNLKNLLEIPKDDVTESIQNSKNITINLFN